MRSKRSSVALALLGVFATVFFLSPPAGADTDISSTICSDFQAPLILQPTEGGETETASVNVSGTGEPGMTVTVKRNGTSIGGSTIAGDGSYAFNVPLVDGANKISIVSQNNCSTQKQSNEIIIHKVTKVTPETPIKPSDPDKTPLQQETPGEEEVSEVVRRQLEGMSPLEGMFVPTPDSSGFTKPTIIHPSDHDKIRGGKVWVAGRAQSGSIVTVYRNAKSIAYTIADQQGNYGVLVVLEIGENILQVRSEMGRWLATSDQITVESLQGKVADVEEGEESPADFIKKVIVPVVATAVVVIGVIGGIHFFRGIKE